MFDRTTLLIIALAVGGALSGLLAGAWLRPMHPVQSATSTLAIGSHRPDIHLPDADGHAQSLQPVALNADNGAVSAAASTESDTAEVQLLVGRSTLVNFGGVIFNTPLGPRRKGAGSILV